MSISEAQLNATERKVYNILKPRLAGLATIVVLKEENNDRIRVDVVSPNHFQRTAAELEEGCGEAAEVTSRAFDVNLTAHWRR